MRLSDVDNNKSYKIAETFYSLQGEGTMTGTPMYFIRLAGCNVGVYTPISPESKAAALLYEDVVSVNEPQLLRVLNDRHSICTTALGTQFLCDTEYQSRQTRTVEELMRFVKHSGTGAICITGGEPLLYDLKPLITAALIAELTVQIETSGTLPIPDYLSSVVFGEAGTSYDTNDVWITCSPKEGYLPENGERINEFKFVVPICTHEDAENSIVRGIVEIIQTAADYKPVYLQPVGGIHDADARNTAYVVELLKRNASRNWRLSVQLHKYLHVS
jgi:7-carboxy-7-deazaguanine synthase